MSAEFPAVETSPPLQRWKCLCAYDGGDFNGWQSQTTGLALQDVIERKLCQLFEVKGLRIHGSGRTDAGVHAHGQVFHFDGEWRHGPEKLLAALRTGLPRSIQIKSAEPVDSTFHARFDALGKTYCYHLYLGDADPFERPYSWSIFRPLDLGLMEEAAVMLRGKHDFRAFCAVNGTEREDTTRDLRRLEIHAEGPRIRITAEADGFLYKMVRSLVGALVSVGEGKLAPEKMRELLLSAKRTAAVHTSPPQGLFLMNVEYKKVVDTK